MNSLRIFRATAGFLFILCIGAATDSNWSQFRGERAGWVVSDTNALTSWDVSSGRGVGWKTAIPRLAHASPIVWGDRVYVATAVRPSRAELKVGLYCDTQSATDQVAHQLAIARH